jgi:hypothetical protein
MDDVYTYAFAKSIGQKVNKSYIDPYDAYYQRSKKGKELCLVSDGKVIEILPTKLITTKWGIACAERVLNIYEKKYPSDKRPRQAILTAKHLVYLRETGASDKEIKLAVTMCRKATNAAADVGLLAYHDAMGRTTYEASNAAYAAMYAGVYATEDLIKFTGAAEYATCAVTDIEKEIEWQRKKLWEIIVDPYFELSKINYHGNFSRLGLAKPFPFRDLGPKIMGY